MKYKTLACASLLIPTLLAFNAPVGRLAFFPSKGDTVTKTFTQDWEMTMDEMGFLMNGQDPGMTPEIEMTMIIKQVVAIADTYGDVVDGRPMSLSRSFKEIDQDMDMEMSMDMMGEVQDQDSTIKGTSELTGTTVVFEWDEDEEEYIKKFANEETDVDEDKLEGLAEDMDLRFLLPDEAVSEGDSWSLDLASLPDLIAPGGDLAWDIEIDGADAAMMGAGPDPAMMGNMRELMGDMLEGEATATFAGVEDGKGIIELKIEIDTARDMTDMVAEMMAEAPEGMAPEIDRMDVEFTIEASGKAFWDMDGGHIAGLELEGDIEITLDMEMSIDMGQAMTIEVSMAMSGSLEQGVEVE
ncbi:MAG: hypothetical protein ACI841_001161 [Planctomycetota bacterium]|jgi:hypothetical protein